MSKWLICFMAMFVLDFIWAEYTAAITAHRKWWAGITAIGITLFAGVATMNWVQDFTLIIPTALGAFAGTALAIHLKVV